MAGITLEADGGELLTGHAAGPNEVLRFWFEDLTTDAWWAKDDLLDQRITETFAGLHTQASRGELFEWRQNPQGRLAEIIILDQFSRNMFRGTARAFAYDALALVLAQEAVAAHSDRALPVAQRAFLFMPYMHSESTLIHEQALKLFACPGMEGNLRFERLHKDIIERFGRYPHRNAALGRPSTPEELEFLKQPGSAF